MPNQTNKKWEEEKIKEFRIFFVSIGGGTALNSKEEVIAQKEHIISFIRTLLKEQRDKILKEVEKCNQNGLMSKQTMVKKLHKFLDK